MGRERQKNVGKLTYLRGVSQQTLFDNDLRVLMNYITQMLQYE